MILPHEPLSAVLAGTRVRGVVAAGVGTDADISRLQQRITPDRLGESLFLVCGQCIHRVENDRFDPLLPLLPRTETVVEYRKEKTFRLAGPGTAGDECGLWLLSFAG